MVKINRAGPRPEHEHPPDEKPQTAPNLTATVRQPDSGISSAFLLLPATDHDPEMSLNSSIAVITQ